MANGWVQGEKTCFVVMGFGRKTDFETGRTLDLDKTYKYIIKPAATAAGFRCVRADEIKHAGPIDVPMYAQLLEADVVIADLSTSNKNAFYELGVRHALRPCTTIIICEDGIKALPFDVNRNLIQQYHHMGDGIDFGEVERFRGLLQDLITTVYARDPRPHDSPVYTFLNGLTPPALKVALDGVARAAATAAPVMSPAAAPAGKAAGRAAAALYSELMADVDAAMHAEKFAKARTLLEVLRERMRPKPAVSQGNAPAAAPALAEDPYIIQRLALAVYKEKFTALADQIAALKEASDLLHLLNPTTSNDTETLGLWGAVHKRLWDKARDPVALDKAVRSYERGFYLRNDHYNGINFAFLLNVRAAHLAELATTSAHPSEVQLRHAEAIADFVRAKRVREEVAAICDKWLAEQTPLSADVPADAHQAHVQSKYWVMATQAEAYLGAGRSDDAAAKYAEAYALAPPAWMLESTQTQRTTLEALLEATPLRFVAPPLVG